MAEGEVILRLDGVAKSFGATTALSDISGTVEAGRITGLVGPDAAGKTTLMRLIAGLMAPDRGRITVLGRDSLKGARHIQAQIGYMPQRFGLYEDLSVAENLRLYADLRGLPAAERRPVFDELLAFTDLGRFGDRLAGRLSGGMKQKLGLACALIRKPRLLLLDEPGVGVDPISRRDLWRMVQGLTEGGTGVLWSTAYLDEAEACAHVLLLDAGRLLFTGPPAGLTARVAGRVVRMAGGPAPRQALARLLDRPEVADGVIQGAALRLVLRHAEAAGGLGALAVPARPRFEDAYVDLLGGGPGGRSALAEATPALPDMTGAVIEAEGLTKRYGDFTAAGDISFAVPQGEIFGLLGPNGAGKSTTFKMLCGLSRPTAGTGRVAGHDLRRDAARARARLGYMAQKFSLYGDLSLRQNLDFFAGVYGLKAAARRARIDLLEEIFDLGPHAGTTAKTLPLGLKQRLALAAAVIHGPEALFLDEPTSGVDPVTRREFWTQINGLVGRGVTVLVTTHFRDEAEYCDRVALIHRGRAIALGPPDALKAAVATPDLPDPTMEDAFVALIRRHEAAP